MLRFHGELDRLTFAEPIPLPEPVEQVEAEIPAQRLFNHLAIALTRSGRPDLYPSQNVLVDRQGCPHLRHGRIIASICS
jgi:hypothetical protein